MGYRRLSLLWRVFAANAGLLVLVAVLLLVTPVTVSAPIRLVEALILGAGLAVALAANFVLLRGALAPLEQLAGRMQTVDLLQPGQRLPSPFSADAPVGRVVHAFNEMLDRLEAERRESGGRALAAQEAERVRIARGLHDEVGQVLTGVLLQLDAVIDAVGPERRHEILEAKQMTRQALDEVRRIAQELRPAMLDHLGLVSALAELTTTFARRSGLSVERSFSNELPRLSADVEIAVYRIAQESLTNIARHAHARHVIVSLQPGVDSVVLRVADDGRGFTEGSAPEGRGGLRGMRERAVLVGGALAIGPGRTGGVEVRLRVPAAQVQAPVGTGE